MGRCYVAEFINVVFQNSLFPSGDTNVYLEQLCKYVDDSVSYYIETAKFAANVVQTNVF